MGHVATGSQAWNVRQARSCWRCDDGRKAANRVETTQAGYWGLRPGAKKFFIWRDRMSATRSPRPSADRESPAGGGGRPPSVATGETTGRAGATESRRPCATCMRGSGAEVVEAWLEEETDKRTRRLSSRYFDNPPPERPGEERKTPNRASGG